MEGNKQNNKYESLPYKYTPNRNEDSGIIPIRRKFFNRSTLNRYKNKYLNSTANVSNVTLDQLPVYSPQKTVNHVRNPFEQARLLKDKLSQPVCSPGFCQEPASPIKKSCDFTWSIEDISTFRPAQIDENPSQEFASFFSPDTESQAQEAIDRFFSSVSQEVLESPIVPKVSNNKNEVACQTKLTFPPFLPEAVEAELLALCQRISSVADDSMNSSTCSARRKIFSINDSASDADMSDQDEVTPNFAATPIRRLLSSPDVSPISPERMSFIAGAGEVVDASMGQSDEIPSR